MSDIDPDDLSNIRINYDKIIESTEMLSVTRMLAIDIKKNPYTTVGDFIKNLSDGDLGMLLDIIDRDNMDDDVAENNVHLSDIMMIAEILARAEGLETNDLEDITKRMQMMSIYIVIESLTRKGLVKPHYHNMSFGDDAGDKMIVEKLF
jgi:hypothetical protein